MLDFPDLSPAEYDRMLEAIEQIAEQFPCEVIYPGDWISLTFYAPAKPEKSSKKRRVSL